jgi:hypothetical protein
LYVQKELASVLKESDLEDKKNFEVNCDVSSPEGLEKIFRSVKTFSEKLLSIKIDFACDECNEMFPDVKASHESPNICTTCFKLGKKVSTAHKFGARNDMDPREIPSYLPELTEIEEALIAPATQFIEIHRYTGGNTKYRGNVCLLPQKIQEWITKLPHKVKDVGFLIVRKQDERGYNKEYRARRGALEAWITHKINYDPDWQEYTLDHSNLSEIPIDSNVGHLLPHVDACDESIPDIGVPASGLHETSKVQDTTQLDESYTEFDTPYTSGACALDPNATEDDSTSATIKQIMKGRRGAKISDPSQAVAWPEREEEPINEFTCNNFLARAFPTLFPYGGCQLRTARRVGITPSVRVYTIFAR